MQKRLKIASFLFEGMDLLLMPIPEPFSRIASLALKAGQHLTSRSLEKGGRWLLHMEEIDTRIQRDT
jgi:hypothetical protein